MARIRSIKPSIWTDQRFISLSRNARLLCLGMISHADDEGRLLASPAKLGGEVFPADEIRPGVVKGWRDEIADSGLITVYVVSGVEYAVFPNWAKHQRISKPQPSTLPSPDDARTQSAPVPQPVAEPVDTQSDPSRAPKETGDRRQDSALAGEIEKPISQRGGQRVVGAWIDRQRQRPPERVVGQAAKLVGELLDQDFAPDVVGAALDEMTARSLNPATLPSLVHGIVNGGGGAPRPSANSQHLTGAMARAQAAERGLPE